MRLAGFLDAITNGICEGWAWDHDHPETPLHVEIFLDGKLVITVTADRLREDLRQQGVGNGRHAFRADISRHLKPKVKSEVRARVQGLDLNNSPLLAVMPIAAFDRFTVPQSQGAVLERFHGAKDERQLTLDQLVERVVRAQRDGRVVFVTAPTIDWNTTLFQRPQHMATAMARAGAVSIYCSPRNRYDVFEGSWELEPGLIVTSALDELVDRISGCWVTCYSTSPTAGTAFMRRASERNFVIYEYVDHLDPTISGEWMKDLASTYVNLDAAHCRLFLATATNLRQELVDRFGPDDVVLIGNGTEITPFTSALESPVPVAQMEALRRQTKGPLIGYYGALAQWLDYKLVRDLAELMPEVQFAFIGPIYDDSVVLPDAPNLHFLGAVPYHSLPQWARYFDAMFIPFKPGKVAQSTSPLKLFEHFALEKPVIVNADMRECMVFDVVRGASSAEEYRSQILRALDEKDSASFRTRLRNAARENTWEAKASTLLTEIRRRNSPRNFHVDRSIMVAVESGNLEASLRRPPCRLHQEASVIRFGLLDSTLRRGDYVLARLLLPDPSGVRGWRVRIAAFESEMVRQNAAFGLQVILDGRVVLDDIVGDTQSDLDFSFVTADRAPALRLVVLRDLPEDWHWGMAASVTIRHLESTTAEGRWEGVGFVSSSSAIRVGEPKAVPAQEQKSAPRPVVRLRRQEGRRDQR